MNSSRIDNFPFSTAWLVLPALVFVCLIGAVDTVRAQNPAAEKVIYNFAPATGSSPEGLTSDSAGNLYAATIFGGSNHTCFDGCGSILKVSPPNGGATTLFTLVQSGLHSQYPSPAGLARDANGNLYTALGYAGRYHFGAVFKLTPSGSAGNLYSFQGGQDGSTPASGVSMDSAGNLYGTTIYGGGTGCSPNPGCGVVYKITRSGVETVLYRFTGGADGAEPLASPILDADGNLYGTALGGGDLACSLDPGFGCGTVWKLDTSGNFTILYTFMGGTDGGIADSGLVMDPSGNLYGDAFYGGVLSCNAGLGCGVVYKIDSSGNFTVLYSFAGGSADGELPAATLLRDTAGNLYGTTQQGGDQSCIGFGTPGCGVVFKLDASGNETILHIFTGGTTDGVGPRYPLITDGKGNLYGITESGGLANGGVIFKVQKQ